MMASPQNRQNPLGQSHEAGRGACRWLPGFLVLDRFFRLAMFINTLVVFGKYTEAWDQEVWTS